MAAQYGQSSRHQPVDETRAIVTKDEETFAEQNLKETAATILESNELLIWHAMNRNEVHNFPLFNFKIL